MWKFLFGPKKPQVGTLPDIPYSITSNSSEEYIYPGAMFQKGENPKAMTERRGMHTKMHSPPRASARVVKPRLAGGIDKPPAAVLKLERVFEIDIIAS